LLLPLLLPFLLAAVFLAGGRGEHQRGRQCANQDEDRENAGLEHERASLWDGISGGGNRSSHSGQQTEFLTKVGSPEGRC